MLQPIFYTSAIFFFMLLMLELGRFLHRRHRIAGDAVPEGLGTLESAVFGLFGLLLAFSFSGAVERFSERRSLVVKEANSIGSAWQRLDLLPEKDKQEQKARFRKYVDARLEAYGKLPDVPAFIAGLTVADGINDQIWAAAIAASLNPQRPVDYGSLLLPALQEMSDVALERMAAFRNHPPTVIFVMLFVLCLLSSLLAGYSLGDHEGRRAIHRIIFAIAVAITVYVTIDLEYPRFGLIRVDAADIFLKQLRDTMK